MPSVTIAWGNSSTRESNDTRQTYEFETLAELNAFLLGISESEGWDDWEQIDEPATADSN